VEAYTLQTQRYISDYKTKYDVHCH